MGDNNTAIICQITNKLNEKHNCSTEQIKIPNYDINLRSKSKQIKTMSKEELLEKINNYGNDDALVTELQNTKIPDDINLLTEFEETGTIEGKGEEQTYTVTLLQKLLETNKANTLEFFLNKQEYNSNELNLGKLFTENFNIFIKKNTLQKLLNYSNISEDVKTLIKKLFIRKYNEIIGNENKEKENFSSFKNEPINELINKDNLKNLDISENLDEYIKNLKTIQTNNAGIRSSTRDLVMENDTIDILIIIAETLKENLGVKRRGGSRKSVKKSKKTNKSTKKGKKTKLLSKKAKKLKNNKKNKKTKKK